ncbi:hypothetical protein DFH27DRAFT_610133 [Peziza echinospora]|nr:hypothetical protein DFH27DRAFT_610133 [Peziza echinospora]
MARAQQKRQEAVQCSGPPPALTTVNIAAVEIFPHYDDYEEDTYASNMVDAIESSGELVEEVYMVDKRARVDTAADTQEIERRRSRRAEEGLNAGNELERRRERILSTPHGLGPVTQMSQTISAEQSNRESAMAEPLARGIGGGQKKGGGKEGATPAAEKKERKNPLDKERKPIWMMERTEK